MAGNDNHFSTSEVRPYYYPQLLNSKPVTTWYPPENYPIGFIYLDYKNTADARIKSYFDSVKYNEKNQNFDTTIHLDAWNDTQMYVTECTWIDYFKHDRELQTGKVTLKPDQWTQSISFPTEFADQPAVIVWLSGFDLGHTADWHFSVDAQNVTKQGFQIVGSVLGTTKLNSMEATWIAYPSSRPNIDSGRFDTLEVRPDDKRGQFRDYKTITFKKNFQRVPKVYFAVNKIHSFNAYNLRLRSYVADMTTKGMTAWLDCWQEANKYSAAGDWIAIQDY